MVRFVKIFGSLYKTECCIYGKRYILFNRFAPAEALKFRYLWYSGKKDSDFEYDIYHGFKYLKKLKFPKAYTFAYY